MVRERKLNLVLWAGLALVFVVLSVAGAVGKSSAANPAQPAEQTKDAPPKYVATFYNGGKVVEMIEADEFAWDKMPRVSFTGRNGKQIHIVGNIVIRETDTTDFAALQAEREKTKKMRELLTLKRQEAAIQAEMKRRQTLFDEMKSLETKGESEPDNKKEDKKDKST